jgi:methylmalonic aciduria homocystinuria type C protein
MKPLWQQLANLVQAGCAEAGLDLVQPFAVEAYNRAVSAEYRLPDFGRARALGILIGNTRALWPCFVAALRAAPERLDDPHPLDRYVAEHVLAALQSVPLRWEVRWAQDGPPRRVAMQRLAHVSGLAFPSPTFLSIHAVFGPWIALRAAVVIDAEGPPAAPEIPNPCSGCEERCLPALRRALASLGEGPATQTGIAQQWMPWVAVRDACSVGQEHRYGEEQIRYHYAKDRTVLAQAHGHDGALRPRSGQA